MTALGGLAALDAMISELTDEGAAIVRALTAENRDLARQLVDAASAATLWQERAGVLTARLALTGPQQPQAPSGAPHLPEPTTEPSPSPEPFPWPIPPHPNARALAPWLVILAILGAAALLGWPFGG